MATPTSARERPLSPHLGIYRFTPTMAMSILHRITGVANYFGTLLVAWWLIAASISPGQFSYVSGFLGSWFGMLVLFGYSWSVLHHMLGGIRHLIWDTGHGLEKPQANSLAWATLIGSATLTVIVWVAAIFARGGF